MAHGGAVASRLTGGTTEMTTPTLFAAHILTDQHFVTGERTYTVDATFLGVDRCRSHGISTGADHALAERLLAAVKAGKVFTNLRVAKDRHGKTYCAYDCAVIGRHLNADLKQLGF
jgi:hypothetical protein